MKVAVCLIFLASGCLGCILEDLRADVNQLNSTSGQLEEDLEKVQDNLEVVQENLDDRIDSVLERLEESYEMLEDRIKNSTDDHIKLKEKVESIETTLNSTTAQLNLKVDTVEQDSDKKYVELEGDVQTIDEILAKFDDMVEKIQEKMEDKSEEVQEDFEAEIDELEDKLEAIEETQAKLEKRLETLEAKKDNENGPRTWHLGMNINPADGHIFGYTKGWATGDNIGSDEEALTKDYLSGGVWDEPANYIAIVRHQQGVLDAVKVFKFKHWGTSLYTRFGQKNMDPGRQIVTKGGPIQESVAVNATNLGDDPIFSVGGDLAFNWAFSDNGCRIVLTGGHLSGADDNDDNTHGLGNDYNCNSKTGRRYSTYKEHDVSIIQDCSYSEDCRDVKVQGTDHGKSYKDGLVYGNYAIYVSMNAKTFPLPGSKLDLKIEL